MKLTYVGSLKKKRKPVVDSDDDEDDDEVKKRKVSDTDQGYNHAYTYA